MQKTKQLQEIMDRTITADQQVTQQMLMDL